MAAEIHAMIHRLTQNEKRYFRIHASLGYTGQRKQYLRLFESILRQGSYNEKALKQKLGSLYFAQYKKQLEHKILESLRAFHAGKSAEDTLGMEIANFHLFRQKGLWKRASDALERAEELARKNQLFPELLRVLDLSSGFIAQAQSAGKIRRHVESVRKEIPLIQKKMDKALEVKAHYLSFVTLNKENEFLRHPQDIESALHGIRKLKRQFQNEELPAVAQMQWYYTEGLCYFLCGRPDESLRAFHLQLKLFSDYAFLKTACKEEYLKCLGNLALLSLICRDKKYFELCMDALAASKTKAKDAVASVNNYRFFLLRLKQLVLNGTWAEAARFQHQQEKEVSRMEAEFRKANILRTERDYVFFDTLRLRLENKDRKSARQMLNVYFSENDGSQKTDNYVMARCLFILMSIQQEQYDVAINDLRSLRRFIRSKKRDFAFESGMLKYLGTLIAHPLPEEQKKSTRQFIAQLNSLEKIPSERTAFLCFDVRDWLEGLHGKLHH